MKRVFGNWLFRLLRGGVKLSSLEFEFLVLLVDALPPKIRRIVEAQFDAYNLVQRESDGRALNFYCIKGRRPTTNGMPLLETTQVEAPLIRITASITNERAPVHAVLTAVDGRAFSVAFSRRVDTFDSAKVVEVTRTRQAWRSVISHVATAAWLQL